MTILIASPDDDASVSVQSSLERAKHPARWVKTLNAAFEAVFEGMPHVCVTDTALDGYRSLIERVRQDAPWARLHLMADPARPAPIGLNLQVVPKPFDAAELAEVLAREEELAELARGKRDLQTHVDELARLVQECFEAIVGLDRNGLIRTWNPGAVRLYGYSEEEALGRSIALLDPFPDVVTERLTGGARQILETARRHKDGRTVHVLLSLSPLPDSASDNFRFVEVSLDITEHRSLKRQLEHSERLAAIGRIAAGMAHEINNPLAVIQASSAYVSDVARHRDDGELGECAADLRVAVERIKSFVEHVCGFARRERPELSDVAVGAAIEMALRMVRPRARARGIEIGRTGEAGVSVPHDPPRVSQAILNLLSNAVDAAAGKVHLGVRVDGGNLVIEVDDDGPGIPSEFVEHAFEPFATTKPYGQGTGLGLAITRQIVEDHGGSVSLSRRSGAGTHAELRLPLLDPARHRVLVLEDDPELRRSLVADLGAAGFEVRAPENRVTAEAEFERGASAVITRGTFCERSGLELTEWIAARCAAAEQLLVAAEGASDEPRVSEPALPYARDALVTSLRLLCLARREVAATSAG